MTDEEGFDPYRDTVGPGIYGGVVKRGAAGRVVEGRQYQGHNPRPGPVYAGGGYTPMSQALGDDAAVAKLLDKYPALVNDVSTGGAQPLHMCGMGRGNEGSTGLLIRRGADVEALDTYGMTPLQRMATNNLAVGAAALLRAGADPDARGGARETPLALAKASGATGVEQVLRRYQQRANVGIRRIHVAGAAPSVSGSYAVTLASEVPQGFAAVCQAQGWSTGQTWAKLNAGAPWYKADNGAYVYFNQADGHWWIDAPQGHGVYKARGPAHAPPQLGWKVLVDGAPVPELVATFRDLPAST